ncbi:MAG: hypothetical protein AB7F65_11905 [Dehalococcoidia bacterium]
MHAIDRADDELTAASEHEGPRALRLALALVYLWFGALKLRPAASAAEELAGRTVQRLTGGHVGVQSGARAIGILECVIGVLLLNRAMSRPAVALIPLHLLGASSPLVVFPRRCFRRPWIPTLEGQYILKNAVLAAAAFELVARGRRR